MYNQLPPPQTHYQQPYYHQPTQPYYYQQPPPPIGGGATGLANNVMNTGKKVMRTAGTFRLVSYGVGLTIGTLVACVLILVSIYQLILHSQRKTTKGELLEDAQCVQHTTETTDQKTGEKRVSTHQTCKARIQFEGHEVTLYVASGLRKGDTQMVYYLPKDPTGTATLTVWPKFWTFLLVVSFVVPLLLWIVLMWASGSDTAKTMLGADMIAEKVFKTDLF